MNKLIGFALLAVLVAGGCNKPSVSIDDGKGNTVTTSGDGKVSVKSADGSSVTTENGKTTVKDAKGGTTAEVGKGLTEADLGVPFYPGSTETPSTGKIDTPDTKQRSCVRTSSDTPEKVIEFYKPKVKEPSSMSMSKDGNDAQMLTGKLEDGSSVIINASRDKDKTETDISVVVTKDLKK